MSPRIPPRFVMESLTLDVYIIGYRTQGESILLVVKSDGIVCYSCVIDSFEDNAINKTIDLINKLKIKTLDLICWTHPDEDHSLGIDTIISEYSSPKTTVLIPYGLNGEVENIEYNERIQNAFDLTNDNIIKSRYPKSTYHVLKVSNCTNITYRLYSYKEDDYPFEIYSLSPSSQLIDRRGLVPLSKPNKNDYSIALCVRFKKLELFFGSDIENININQMKYYFSEYIPESFNLIKVPHHTSFSSNNLLDLLNMFNKSDLACSTVFRNNKLPEKELINEYKQYSKMFLCTGNVLDENDNCDFGCIHVTYNLLQKEASIELSGNANMVFENFTEPIQTHDFRYLD